MENQESNLNETNSPTAVLENTETDIALAEDQSNFADEKEIRNDDVELQKVINGKLTDDVKNRRNRSSVKPRSFPWRCKVYRCEP